jgi:hypothetical protein
MNLRVREFNRWGEQEAVPVIGRSRHSLGDLWIPAILIA